jgi:hypothetical protein
MCGGMAQADGVCWRSIQHQGDGSTGTTATAISSTVHGPIGDPTRIVHWPTGTPRTEKEGWPPADGVRIYHDKKSDVRLRPVENHDDPQAGYGWHFNLLVLNTGKKDTSLWNFHVYFAGADGINALWRVAILTPTDSLITAGIISVDGGATVAATTAMPALAKIVAFYTGNPAIENALVASPLLQDELEQLYNKPVNPNNQNQPQQVYDSEGNPISVAIWDAIAIAYILTGIGTGIATGGGGSWGWGGGSNDGGGDGLCGGIGYAGAKCK